MSVSLVSMQCAQLGLTKRKKHRSYNIEAQLSCGQWFEQITPRTYQLSRICAVTSFRRVAACQSECANQQSFYQRVIESFIMLVRALPVPTCLTISTKR